MESSHRLESIFQMRVHLVLDEHFLIVIEITKTLCYIELKERHLRQQVPFRNPTPKVELPKWVIYLLKRGAHPGANRVGIFLFTLISLVEKGKQCYK